MSGSIGPLLAADESFFHQIVDTHATVLQSDYSWGEKVWGTVFALDGSLSVGFGFGKYVNRNVVDGYGGVSRGVEQWTVRASRALAADPDTVDVGPLHYEIIEPLRRVRVWLEKNDTQPIAFDLTLDGVVPCCIEEREDRRTQTGYRHSADQIRYHQTGRAHGWIEIDGIRTEVTDERWGASRDRSWGVRPTVGLPPPDLPSDRDGIGAGRTLAVWTPMLFQGADGDYAFFHYYLLYEGRGWRHEVSQASLEHPDGRREALAIGAPSLRFDPANTRLLSGAFRFRTADGRARTLTLKALGGTGFHLGAGLYLGFDGHHQGEWRGALNVEGEYFSDCTQPASAKRLNQFRDCVIQATDSAGSVRGCGICQTWVEGRWPDMGLDDGTVS